MICVCWSNTPTWVQQRAAETWKLCLSRGRRHTRWTGVLSVTGDSAHHQPGGSFPPQHNRMCERQRQKADCCSVKLIMGKFTQQVWQNLLPAMAALSTLLDYFPQLGHAPHWQPWLRRRGIIATSAASKRRSCWRGRGRMAATWWETVSRCLEPMHSAYCEYMKISHSTGQQKHVFVTLKRDLKGSSWASSLGLWLCNAINIWPSKWWHYLHI